MEHFLICFGRFLGQSCVGVLLEALPWNPDAYFLAGHAHPKHVNLQCSGFLGQLEHPKHVNLRCFGFLGQLAHPKHVNLRCLGAGSPKTRKFTVFRLFGQHPKHVNSQIFNF